MRILPCLMALGLVPLLAGCSGESTPSAAKKASAPPPKAACVAPSVVPIPAGCTDCHEMPPTSKRHPADARCSHCHGYVVDADFHYVDKARHNDGTIDVAVGCSSCHGWNLGVSPPPDLGGACASKGVGAHFAMRQGAIPAHQVGCINCHPVPLVRESPGHDDGKIDIVFAALATAKGAKPTWDGSSCAGTYCHGATLQGGTLTAPKWLDDSHAPGACGACHALSCPKGAKGSDCHACHAASVDASRAILPEGKHLNGMIDVVAPKAAGAKP